MPRPLILRRLGSGGSRRGRTTPATGTVLGVSHAPHRSPPHSLWDSYKPGEPRLSPSPVSLVVYARPIRVFDPMQHRSAGRRRVGTVRSNRDRELADPTSITAGLRAASDGSSPAGIPTVSDE